MFQSETAMERTDYTNADTRPTLRDVTWATTWAASWQWRTVLASVPAKFCDRVRTVDRTGPACYKPMSRPKLIRYAIWYAVEPTARR